MARKGLIGLLLAALILNVCLPAECAFAQVMPRVSILEPGRAGEPVFLQGLRVYPQEQLKFDLIIDTGTSFPPKNTIEFESQKSAKYFLTAMTVPEKDLWVNLSPYEKDRIIPEEFARTEMGRDLLEADLLLKQFTSSLMFPENELGRKLWQKIYALSAGKDIAFDNFNKVWIVPDEAHVVVHDNTAVITRCHLKVMLETDYLAMSNEPTPTRGHVVLSSDQAQQNNVSPGRLPTSQPLNARATQVSPSSPNLQELTNNILREIIIPVLEKEVNSSERFGNLRQIYRAMILATWYQRHLKEGLLGAVYAQRNKVAGIDPVDRQEKIRLWEKYAASFKQGLFNYIKEELDASTGEIIPRKYFAGGCAYDSGVLTETKTDAAMLAKKSGEIVQGERQLVSIELKPVAKPYVVDQAQSLTFPKVENEALLKILNRTAENPRDAILAFRLSAMADPRLVPEIVAAYVDLSRKSEWKDAVLLGLAEIRRYAPEYTALALAGFGAVALAGNKGAVSSIRKLFSYSDRDVADIVARLDIAAQTGNINAWYAIGVMVIDENERVLHVLGEERSARLVEYLQERVFKTGNVDEVKAISRVVSGYRENNKTRQLAYLSLEKIAGSEFPAASREALEQVIVRAEEFTEVSLKAKLLAEASHARLELAAQLKEQSAGDNSSEKMHLYKYFERGLDQLIFSLAQQAQEAGVSIEYLLHNYRNWRRLNIFRPLFWPDKLREEIFNYRNLPKDDFYKRHEKVAVVVYPKSDHNGAFMNTDILTKLSELGYAILYYEAESPEEMIKSLEDATVNGQHPSRYTIIGGHGSPESMRFGHGADTESLLYSDHDLLDKADLKRFFVAGSDLVLRSCANGGVPHKRDLNMVQALAYATGAKVSGAEKSFSRLEVEEIKPGELLHTFKLVDEGIMLVQESFVEQKQRMMLSMTRALENRVRAYLGATDDVALQAMFDMLQQMPQYKLYASNKKAYGEFVILARDIWKRVSDHAQNADEAQQVFAEWVQEKISNLSIEKRGVILEAVTALIKAVPAEISTSRFNKAVGLLMDVWQHWPELSDVDFPIAAIGRDAAMRQASQDHLKGGIDLNSALLKLTESGSDKDLAPLKEVTALERNIAGFVPVVLSVSSISKFSLMTENIPH